MANKITGFIGVDNYDVILYLSRILVNLGKKVLLIDSSLTQSLSICIPRPVSMEFHNDVINYRGVDFTKMPLEKISCNKYDVVMIFYGLHDLKDYEICDNLILVSDLQIHNQIVIRKEVKMTDKIKQVIIKDYQDSIITEKRVFDLIDKRTLGINEFVLYQDETELKYRIHCQEKCLKCFNKISKVLKYYLIKTIQLLSPDSTEKDIRFALKKAERGN